MTFLSVCVDTFHYLHKETNKKRTNNHTAVLNVLHKFHTIYLTVPQQCTFRYHLHSPFHFQFHQNKHNICFKLNCIVLSCALLCIKVYWTAATRIGAMFDVPYLRLFRAFPSVVRQMPGYNFKDGARPTLSIISIKFSYFFYCYIL